MTAQPASGGRQSFGARLRALREDAGFTGTALALALGWPGSKVSKIEHGKQAVTVGDVTAWMGAVGGSDELLADLLADLRSLRIEHRNWARLARRGLTGRQRATSALDAATTVLRAFESAVIPGLLQSAEYARCVLTDVVELRGIPDDVSGAVRARIDRQQVLYQSGTQFRFLVTEAALQYRVCSTVAMRGQLDRLLAVSSLDNVELAVIPTTARLPFPAMHGFWIYDERLVLVDTVSSELLLRDDDDIALYCRLFERSWAAAVTGAAVSELVTGLIRLL